MSSSRLVWLIVLLLGLFFLLRRRRPSAPAMPPPPGGPQQVGSLRRLPTHAPITPVRSEPGAVSSSSGPLSPAQIDDLARLDALRASGTLTEEAYLQARARVLGTDTAAGWSVTVLSAGSNKINAIKLVRECRNDLGLKQAKDFVDALPQVLFKGLPQADAERIAHYLEQAGVSARLGQS